MLTKKIKKTVKLVFVILLFCIFAFIAFVLNETKDEVNANLENVEEKIQSFYNENKLGGFAVAVFNRDRVIFSKGFGYADVKNNIPYSEHTQQYMASISKTTIGIALLIAKELGILKLDDPINQYLPFKVFNPKHPTSEITIRHLATHTSSLDYNDEVVESLYIVESQKEKSLEGFMKSYFQQDNYKEVAYSDYSPGSDWNYSNIGAGLAAYIIELKTGMSFADFTKEYIFKPLELENTFWFESKSDSIYHSKYYEPQVDSIIEVETSGVKLYPCRDLITNIQDLTTYCQAIISKDSKLLSIDSYNELLSPSLAKDISNTTIDNSGIFFMIDRNQYGVTYQLTGTNGGDNCINTMMWFDPKTELGYIFIGNTGGDELNRSKHIWIYRTLVSLGDNVLMNNPENSLIDNLKYKWHNWYNRVRALF